MILYQTPEHKHEWVDKGSAYGIEEGRRVYLGILFVCGCGKKEIDSGVTTRIIVSLLQTTLNELPQHLFELPDNIYDDYDEELV